MLLKRLKSNGTINMFLVPVAVFALWAQSLWNPSGYNYSFCENSNILFSPIARLIGTNPLVHVIIGMLLLITLAFMMQLINMQYSFIRIRSKLPPILFVIVVGGFVEMHTLHPVYFSAVFVLFAIYRMFSMFERTKPYSAVFDVGFLLAISSLFCLSMIVLFPAFLISIVVLSRDTKWREPTILLLGFLLPFAFAASYAVLTGTLPAKIDTFVHGITIPVNHFKTNYGLQIYLGFLVLFTFLASIDILKQYDNKKISSRKYFTTFFWIFLFSLTGFVFIPATSQEMLIITAIPGTFLISNYFVFMKKNFWGELLFTLLLAVVIFMQFAGKILNG